MRQENIEDIYELSPLQEGILFHTLLSPKSGMYFEQSSFTLHGPVSVSALEQAWQKVVDRHAILRTSFFWQELDKPLQVVHRKVKLLCEKQDWRGLSHDEQSECLKTYLKADREQSFELSDPPLLRIALFRWADETYQFTLSFHHVLLDGWSLQLLLKEYSNFYDALCQGSDLLLEKSRPYGDYIAWLQQQDLSQAEEYWRRTLAGYKGLPPLWLDNYADGIQADSSEGYDSQQMWCSVETTAALQALSGRHQLTLNTLVQGAWALLLSRYTGKDDVVFGATVSTRPADLQAVESILGLFVNTVPVRVRVTPEASLVAWLKDLQVRQFEARQFDHSPLVRIQGWSEVPRGTPLFDSILGFENYPAADRSYTGREQPVGEFHAFERTNYPLSVLVAPTAALWVKILYVRPQFDPAMITRMLGHFEKLFEEMVANPEQRLSELSLLTESERRLLLEWNETTTAYPRTSTVSQLFERQAEQTPDTVAVEFEGQRLTYRELNRKANQMAHWLNRRAVGPEVVVGVCLERSLEWVVTVLGIVKAGGVYLPLDPTYPKERLVRMLDDAGARILLTEGPWSETLSGLGRQVISVRAERESIAQEGLANPDGQTQAENLIYLMYTSGSTGRPKGVGVPHRAVVRLVKESDYLQVEAGDRVGQASNVSFDAATFEVWGALLNGAGLVGIRQEVLLSPTDLAKQLRKDGISVLFVTTDLMHQLISQQPDVFGSLRALLFGGSQVDARWVREMLQQGPPGRLLHVYGPTENTTFACWQRLETVEPEASTLAIGRPIANTRIQLLDGDFNLVPVGVPAEMYVGGDGLARGYWNHPELTAERFLPDPFSGEAARLYRTGDLGRYRADGSIEFLGRLDQQVKIRGFRVELGEIEAVLRQHGRVREAVVLAREDTPGDKRLVAYVVARGEAGASAATGLEGEKVAEVSPKAEQAEWMRELRSYLKEQLPEYMVPSAVVVLEALPLNPNGKINRQALPSYGARRPELEGDFLAPRNGIEKDVADIWAEVLALGQLGVTDNFFDLGGHSLLATRVVSRLRQSFHIELPLRVLFERPTVAGVAQWIKERQDQPAVLAEESVGPISRASSQEPLTDLNELSDKEVDAMLENLLRKGQTP